MTRSFFDVKCDASIEHDYKGRHLPSFDEAQQMAELIAGRWTIRYGSTNSECRRSSFCLGAGQAGGSAGGVAQSSVGGLSMPLP